MAKLVIILAVLLTLQESYQATLRSSSTNDIGEVVEEILEALKDIDRIIEFIGDHLSSVARDYEHKIDNTIDNENIASMVKQLENSIHKVESNTNDDSIKCIDAALRNEMIANNELKKGVDSCIAVARAVGAEMQSNLKAIDGKALQIQIEINSGMNKCITNKDEEELVNCLRNIIDPVKEQLTDLDRRVNEIDENISKTIEDGIRNLNICLESAEDDFNLKGKKILGDLISCVQNSSSFFKKYTPKSIMDIIRELKETIENILHILSHLPTSIEDIPNKINEIISHINISLLISELKNEVNEAINDGGSNAESCRPTADKRLDDLTASSEAEVKKCIEEAEAQVDEIQADINKLVDEAKGILEDIKNKTLECFNENKLNPLEFYKCLESYVDDLEQKVSELQQKVADTYENAKEQGDEIIKSLATCVNNVQLETINEGQVLIKDVETCVLQSYSMYFMK